MSICVEKTACPSCPSKSANQIFQQDDGSFDSYCFSCGHVDSNPYKDKPVGYKPVFVKKTAEQIKQELEEVEGYRCIALADRKLRKESLEYFNIRIGTSEEDGESPSSLYFPYYRNQELVGYKAKVISTKKFFAIGEQKDVDFFGWQQAMAAGGKKIFITEGELDVVALYQVFKDHNRNTAYADLNPPIISLPHGAAAAAKDVGKFINKIRQHFKEVVLVFDNDAAGRKAVEEVMQLVPEAVSATLPSKDANAALMEGKSKALYNAVVFNAQKPKNTRFVLPSSIKEDARKEAEWGFSYPYAGLTELTRGMHMGDTVYWGAGVKMGPVGPCKIV